MFCIDWVLSSLAGSLGLALAAVGNLPHKFISATVVRSAIEILGQPLAAGALLGVSFLVLGRRGTRAARSSIRLFELHYALFALFLPVTICPAHAFSAIASFRTYAATSIPRLLRSDRSVALLGPVCDCRCLCRGDCLSRDDVARMHRAIRVAPWNLPDCFAWAAAHFRSDSYAALAVSGVLLHLFYRVLVCLAMNYVLCR